MARSATMILGVPGGQERPSQKCAAAPSAADNDQQTGRDQREQTNIKQTTALRAISLRASALI